MCAHLCHTRVRFWDIFLMLCGICQMGLIRKEGFCVHGAHKQNSAHTLAVVVAVVVAVAVAPVVVVVVAVAPVVVAVADFLLS